MEHRHSMLPRLLLAVSGQADRTAATSAVYTVVGLSVLLADDAAFARQLKRKLGMTA